MTDLTPIEHFKEKKYVIVDSAIDSDICEFLTDHLLNLAEQNKTKKDMQCPLSEAIYGDKHFDTLMEDMLPLIESVTGLKLFPTYSYARKYVPGDELKPHLDRSACEISATLTLGYKGKVWPIHISKDEDPMNDLGPIEIEVGSLVVYRGMEINHFRKPYTEGEWQCQVFLHYVDAEGPYKDEKYDSRKSLGDGPPDKKAERIEESKKETDQENLAYPWVFGFAPNQKILSMTKENVLNNLHIDSIINYSRGVNLDLAAIGTLEHATVDKKIRNVAHCWLPTDKLDWLYEMLEREIMEINWINYKYVLTHMERIDYLEYHGRAENDENGKYIKHVDGPINSSRKLSFSILLSDPSEYEGGDLIIYDAAEPIVIPKKKGSMTLFPSNALHEVTPVTKGVRRSIVSWMHGPHFC